MKKDSQSVIKFILKSSWFLFYISACVFDGSSDRKTTYVKVLISVIIGHRERQTSRKACKICGNNFHDSLKTNKTSLCWYKRSGFKDISMSEF